ncbi:hypothetical protein C8R43DRAFT_878649 [Mycena crocata]|nr:hypothetical protein C8R43DRAFT_878649 [Mycena crocata]
MQGECWDSVWADCVDKFLDFEAACGYQEKGPRIGGEDRPDEVQAWLGSGRRWFVAPAIATLGMVGEADSFVDRWWRWWRSIQPPERSWLGGRITRPREITWKKMAGLYGKNGFLQVMGTLLWWGLEEARRAEESGWEKAVKEVHYVLSELIDSGELR